ncbi:DEAD/DEAH box helicase family protein, partial [Thomasclavelia sp.]|uniref:TOTE conflict system archaeo-eukaryotic primase domain-containing protein n=1 Tax=Thomasclavelia sp. TaxID=3025757 RepID=UPI0025F966F4
FYSIFKGRKDVYSKRAGKANKTGYVGYYPQCNNFWKAGICAKRSSQRIKCQDCSNQDYKELNGYDLMNHLLGKKEDCSDVIGIYPILKDETCHFLVFDFDNHDDNYSEDNYLEEVNALKTICKENQINILVERSRSGKGIHIWLFFEKAIKASIARKFGSLLITKAADVVNMKTFKTYDRMIPAQDHIPAGGLGNLIALPLQGQAVKKGNSVFVDDNWQPYYDQWNVLKQIKKISLEFIERKIDEWNINGPLGLLSDFNDDTSEKPWKKSVIQFHHEDVNGTVCITLADLIYIKTTNLQPRLNNQIRRLTWFSNPDFYKTQKMGFSTHGIYRIISCHQEFKDYIGIPRGLKEELIKKLDDAKIHYQIDDQRNKGNPINVEFLGKLYSNQQDASSILTQYETGILDVTTAFGKTVVGAYLIALKKVNTLILVHNREVMSNWENELNKFLKIHEDLPQYQTAKGHIKTRNSCIGKLYANHNSLTKIIDIAMISSLGKGENIKSYVKDYGMVIMDECHHSAAKTNEDVLNAVNAKYVYGLTATAKRNDGQVKKIFMQFGPVRYRFTAKQRAEEQGIGHYIIPRFTRLTAIDEENLTINDAYKLVINSQVRNQQIIDDVINCLDKGRTPLVLTRFKEHAKFLYDQLKDKTNHIFLLQGGRNTKEREKIRKELLAVRKEESIILVAIDKYIGEGFNYPRLDTLMLTTAFKYDGNVEQYAGRLHRDYEDKQNVIIYDYVDSHIRYFEKMYRNRLKAYKKMGYQIMSYDLKYQDRIDAIYTQEDYFEVLYHDLNSAQNEIIISSPGISKKKIQQYLQIFKPIQERGVKIYIITLKPEVYSNNFKDSIENQINEMKRVDIHVIDKSMLYQHFAVIDRKIVWYGSINLLSKEKEEDNLIRVIDNAIAEELIAITNE